MKTYAGPVLNVSFIDQLDQGTEHIQHKFCKVKQS